VLGSVIVLVGIVLAETARVTQPPVHKLPGEGEAGTPRAEGASSLPEGIAP